MYSKSTRNFDITDQCAELLKDLREEIEAGNVASLEEAEELHGKRIYALCTISAICLEMAGADLYECINEYTIDYGMYTFDVVQEIALNSELWARIVDLTDDAEAIRSMVLAEEKEFAPFAYSDRI